MIRQPTLPCQKWSTIIDAREQCWNTFADLHAVIGSPLRPTVCDVEVVARKIRGSEDAVLLLGVTPELSRLGEQLIAVDNSAQMIARVWPGDERFRHAVLADWFALPLADNSVCSVVGDGSLNAVAHELPALFTEIARVLKPNGIAVFRTFCAPEEPEDLQAIRTDVEGGWTSNFHSLKWRIAMLLASRIAERAVAVAEVRRTFDSLFPDRKALADATGWPEEEIATIDHYAHANHSLSFWCLSELLKLIKQEFSSIEVTPGIGYPLAERCPVIVMSGHIKE